MDGATCANLQSEYRFFRDPRSVGAGARFAVQVWDAVRTDFARRGFGVSRRYEQSARVRRRIRRRLVIRKLLLFLTVLFSAGYAVGQGACYPDGSATTVTSTLNNSQVRVISYAGIRVCTEPASGTPCTPLTTIRSEERRVGKECR